MQVAEDPGGAQVWRAICAPLVDVPVGAAHGHQGRPERSSRGDCGLVVGDESLRRGKALFDREWLGPEPRDDPRDLVVDGAISTSVLVGIAARANGMRMVVVVVHRHGNGVIVTPNTNT